MNQPKLTPADVDYRTITFKECEVHNGIRYAGERCPVCAADGAIEKPEKLKEEGGLP